MRKKIAILGSTGSIGKILLNIISKDKKNFDVCLLTAHRDYELIIKQAKKFKVKNIIITDYSSYKIAKTKLKNQYIKIFNNFNSLNKIFKNKKIDYVMSSIVGLDGLKPTLNLIKHTRKIAIANKESIICGWSLIRKEILKYKTKFIPVDSEHFSIWYGLKNNFDDVEKIYLTASGGPFLNYPLNKFKKIKVSQAINHPNWKMGKKISIDSATMMNKVFEIIEAKNLFNIYYDKLFILTHPSSYIHAVLLFKNGLIKIIAHETDMSVPIANTLYPKYTGYKNKIFLNIKKMNKLELNKINYTKYPSVKILDMLPKESSLFETVIVSANDELVNLFLNKKINFNEITSKLMRLLKNKDFNKYKNIKPKNIEDIIKLNNYVRLKVNPKSI